MKQLTEGWSKHKGIVITGAQIVTIITLIVGLVGNHNSINQNAADIGTQNQWMKDAIKMQNSEIITLRIQTAVLQARYDALKDQIIRDETR